MGPSSLKMSRRVSLVFSAVIIVVLPFSIQAEEIPNFANIDESAFETSLRKLEAPLIPSSRQAFANLPPPGVDTSGGAAYIEQKLAEQQGISGNMEEYMPRSIKMAIEKREKRRALRRQEGQSKKADQAAERKAREVQRAEHERDKKTDATAKKAAEKKATDMRRDMDLTESTAKSAPISSTAAAAAVSTSASTPSVTHQNTAGAPLSAAKTPTADVTSTVQTGITAVNSTRAAPPTANNVAASAGTDTAGSSSPATAAAGAIGTTPNASTAAVSSIPSQANTNDATPVSAGNEAGSMLGYGSDSMGAAAASSGTPPLQQWYARKDSGYKVKPNTPAAAKSQNATVAHDPGPIPVDQMDTPMGMDDPAGSLVEENDEQARLVWMRKQQIDKCMQKCMARNTPNSGMYGDGYGYGYPANGNPAQFSYGQSLGNGMVNGPYGPVYAGNEQQVLQYQRELGIPGPIRYPMPSVPTWGSLGQRCQPCHHMATQLDELVAQLNEESELMEEGSTTADLSEIREESEAMAELRAIVAKGDIPPADRDEDTAEMQEFTQKIRSSEAYEMGNGGASLGDVSDGYDLPLFPY